ncbi:MAG: DUF4239 domain-containing protein [Ignavibacteria bacterium]|nr:DUF4239 domain-containing protein [Ignavibacteria bacterium]
MKIFLELPFIVSIIIISVISIIIFHLLQKLVRRKIPHELLIENHEVGGFLYNAVCVIYAVLIAFVVFVIWNNNEETNSKIEGEANDLLNLYYDAGVYPDSIKKEIQSTIRDYVQRVTTDEWKTLSQGNADSAATKVFIKLNRIYMNVNSSQVPNSEVLAQSMKSIHEMREFRRHRILSSKQNMPDILWLVLILSSIILVAFTFFFSTKNIWHQYIMTAFLVFVSVLVLYLIYVLDHPFVGTDAIKPDAFQPLMDIIKRAAK